MIKLYVHILSVLLIPVSLFAQDSLQVKPGHICLNITEHPENQQAISWRTQSSEKNGMVIVKKYSGAGDIVDTVYSHSLLFSSDDGDWYYHEATLKNLLPETKYSYKVGAGNKWSDWYGFTTASLSGMPFSFLYFGDVQREIASIGSQNIKAAITKEPESSFLLFAGDLVNDGKKNIGEWNDFFLAGDSAFLYYPVFAVTGNHEHSIKGISYKPDDNWYYHFALPRNGPKCSPEETYYFDYNQARFISLNTSSFISNPFVRCKTKRWLKRILKASDGKWVIVSHHHPVFSTKMGRRNKSLERTLKPIYEKYGVALVLTGHDHTYGRGMVPGTTNPVYVVSNAGGKYYNIGIRQWMQRAGSDITTYQVIQVSPQSIHYKSYLMTGELYDEFIIKREKGGFQIVDKQENAIDERLKLPVKYRNDFSPKELQEYNTMIDNYLKSK